MRQWLKCFFGRHEWVYCEGFATINDDCQRCMCCPAVRAPVQRRPELQHFFRCLGY